MSAPTSAPIVGVNDKVILTDLTTSGAPVTLLNSNYKLNKTSKNAEVPNTTDGTRRVKGRRDATVTIEGWQDTSSGANIEADCTEGDTVDLQLFQGAKKYEGAFIIDALNIETGVDDPVKWTIEASLAYGTVTGPT